MRTDFRQAAFWTICMVLVGGMAFVWNIYGLSLWGTLAVTQSLWRLQARYLIILCGAMDLLFGFPIGSHLFVYSIFSLFRLWLPDSWISRFFAWMSSFSALWILGLAFGQYHVTVGRLILSFCSLLVCMGVFIYGKRFRHESIF